MRIFNMVLTRCTPASTGGDPGLKADHFLARHSAGDSLRGLGFLPQQAGKHERLDTELG